MALWYFWYTKKFSVYSILYWLIAMTCVWQTFTYLETLSICFSTVIQVYGYKYDCHKRWKNLKNMLPPPDFSHDGHKEEHFHYLMLENLFTFQKQTF